MTMLRRTLALFSLLALCLTGLGVAMDRGAMAAAGQLCSVTTPVALVLSHDGLPLLDADGDPVTLAQDVCLDCIIGAADRAPSVATAASPLDRAGNLSHVSPTPLVSAVRLTGGSGRGPPARA